MAAQRGGEITHLSLETRVPGEALNSRNPHSRGEAATKEEIRAPDESGRECFACALKLDCAGNLQIVLWKPHRALPLLSPGQRQRPLPLAPGWIVEIEKWLTPS